MIPLLSVGKLLPFKIVTFSSTLLFGELISYNAWSSLIFSIINLPIGITLGLTFLLKTLLVEIELVLGIG